MKAVVVYTSLSGHTQRYAEMISKELNAPLWPLKEAKRKVLKEYDLVVYGGPVHIYKIKGWPKLRRRAKNKTILLFACGGNPGIEEEVSKIRSNSILESDGNVTFFYLPGGLDISKLKGIYRFMMGIAPKMIEKKPDKTPEDIAFLEAWGTPRDFVDPVHTEALVKTARGLIELRAGKGN